MLNMSEVLQAESLQVNKLKAESRGVECLKANSSCINLDYDRNLAAFSGDGSLQKRVRKKSGKEIACDIE